jgi:hypothetical protein
MQQEIFFSYHALKLATQQDATVYSLEFMAHLHLVAHGRPPYHSQYHLFVLQVGIVFHNNIPLSGMTNNDHKDTLGQPPSALRF